MILAKKPPVLLPDSISTKGLEFIARFEGFRAQPYNDAAGHATVGYGHLLHYGPVTEADKVKYRNGISRGDALDLLAVDARKATIGVKQNVKVHLTTPQFDALVSFAFNCGVGALAGSTLLKRLNKGDYNSVPSELMKWVKAGGQTLPGLVNRRRAEGDLFAHGVYR